MILKHMTYRCDICGKECENCITSRNVEFNIYLNEEMSQKVVTEKFDICTECYEIVHAFIRNLKENSKDHKEINGVVSDSGKRFVKKLKEE